MDNETQPLMGHHTDGSSDHVNQMSHQYEDTRYETEACVTYDGRVCYGQPSGGFMAPVHYSTGSEGSLPLYYTDNMATTLQSPLTAPYNQSPANIAAHQYTAAYHTNIPNIGALQHNNGATYAVQSQLQTRHPAYNASPANIAALQQDMFTSAPVMSPCVSVMSSTLPVYVGGHDMFHQEVVPDTNAIDNAYSEHSESQIEVFIEDNNDDFNEAEATQHSMEVVRALFVQPTVNNMTMDLRMQNDGTHVLGHQVLVPMANQSGAHVYDTTDTVNDDSRLSPVIEYKTSNICRLNQDGPEQMNLLLSDKSDSSYQNSTNVTQGRGRPKRVRSNSHGLEESKLVIDLNESNSRSKLSDFLDKKQMLRETESVCQQTKSPGLVSPVYSAKAVEENVTTDNTKAQQSNTNNNTSKFSWETTRLNINNFDMSSNDSVKDIAVNTSMCVAPSTITQTDINNGNITNSQVKKQVSVNGTRKITNEDIHHNPRIVKPYTFYQSKSSAMPYNNESSNYTRSPNTQAKDCTKSKIRDRDTNEDILYALAIGVTCNCPSDLTHREEYPVEQLFTREGQLFRIAEAQIIRLGGMDLYAFLKQDHWYTPLSLFFQKVGTEVQALYDSLLTLTPDVKLKLMEEEEFVLVRQRCQLPKSSGKELISVQDLVNLSDIILEFRENAIVQAVAQDQVYIKVLGKDSKCSSCALPCKSTMEEVVYNPVESVCNKTKPAELVDASVGHLTIGDVEWTAFDMLDTVYVNLKDIVKYKVCTVDFLKNRLAKLQYFPIIAPLEVQNLLDDSSESVGITLWYNIEVIRSVVLMSKKQPLNLNEEQLKDCIRHDQYKYISSHVLKCQDTTVMKNKYIVYKTSLELCDVEESSGTGSFGVNTQTKAQQAKGRPEITNTLYRLVNDTIKVVGGKRKINGDSGRPTTKKKSKANKAKRDETETAVSSIVEEYHLTLTPEQQTDTFSKIKKKNPECVSSEVTKSVTNKEKVKLGKKTDPVKLTDSKEASCVKVCISNRGKDRIVTCSTQSSPMATQEIDNVDNAEVAVVGDRTKQTKSVREQEIDLANAEVNGVRDRTKQTNSVREERVKALIDVIEQETDSDNDLSPDSTDKSYKPSKSFTKDATCTVRITRGQARLIKHNGKRSLAQMKRSRSSGLKTKNQSSTQIADRQRSSQRTESRVSAQITEKNLSPQSPHINNQSSQQMVNNPPLQPVTNSQSSTQIMESQLLEQMTDSQTLEHISECPLSPKIADSHMSSQSTEKDWSPQINNQSSQQIANNQPLQPSANSQSLQQTTNNQSTAQTANSQSTAQIANSQSSQQISKNQLLQQIFKSHSSAKAPENQLMPPITRNQLSTQITDSQSSLQITESQSSLQITESQSSLHITEKQLPPQITDSQLHPKITSTQLSTLSTDNHLSPIVTRTPTKGSSFKVTILNRNRVISKPQNNGSKSAMLCTNEKEMTSVSHAVPCTHKIPDVIEQCDGFPQTVIRDYEISNNIETFTQSNAKEVEASNKQMGLASENVQSFLDNNVTEETQVSTRADHSNVKILEQKFKKHRKKLPDKCDLEPGIYIVNSCSELLRRTKKQERKRKKKSKRKHKDCHILGTDTIEITSRNKEITKSCDEIENRNRDEVLNTSSNIKLNLKDKLEIQRKTEQVKHKSNTENQTPNEEPLKQDHRELKEDESKKLTPLKISKFNAGEYSVVRKEKAIIDMPTTGKDKYSIHELPEVTIRLKNLDSSEKVKEALKQDQIMKNTINTPRDNVQDNEKEEDSVNETRKSKHLKEKLLLKKGTNNIPSANVSEQLSTTKDIENHEHSGSQSKQKLKIKTMSAKANATINIVPTVDTYEETVTSEVVVSDIETGCVNKSILVDKNKKLRKSKQKAVKGIKSVYAIEDNNYMDEINAVSNLDNCEDTTNNSPFKTLEKNNSLQENMDNTNIEIKQIPVTVLSYSDNKLVLCSPYVEKRPCSIQPCDITISQLRKHQETMKAYNKKDIAKLRYKKGFEHNVNIPSNIKSRLKKRLEQEASPRYEYNEQIVEFPIQGIELGQVIEDSSQRFEYEQNVVETPAQRFELGEVVEQPSLKFDNEENFEFSSEKFKHGQIIENPSQNFEHEQNVGLPSQRFECGQNIEDINHNFEHEQNVETISQKFQLREVVEAPSQRFEYGQNIEDINHNFEHEQNIEAISQKFKLGEVVEAPQSQSFEHEQNVKTPSQNFEHPQNDKTPSPKYKHKQNVKEIESVLIKNVESVNATTEQKINEENKSVIPEGNYSEVCKNYDLSELNYNVYYRTSEQNISPITSHNMNPSLKMKLRKANTQTEEQTGVNIEKAHTSQNYEIVKNSSRNEKRKLATITPDLPQREIKSVKKQKSKAEAKKIEQNSVENAVYEMSEVEIKVENVESGKIKVIENIAPQFDANSTGAISKLVTLDKHLLEDDGNEKIGKRDMKKTRQQHNKMKWHKMSPMKRISASPLKSPAKRKTGKPPAKRKTAKSPAKCKPAKSAKRKTAKSPAKCKSAKSSIKSQPANSFAKCKPAESPAKSKPGNISELYPNVSHLLSSPPKTAQTEAIVKSTQKQLSKTKQDMDKLTMHQAVNSSIDNLGRDTPLKQGSKIKECETDGLKKKKDQDALVRSLYSKVSPIKKKISLDSSLHMLATVATMEDSSMEQGSDVSWQTSIEAPSLSPSEASLEAHKQRENLLDTTDSPSSSGSDTVIKQELVLTPDDHNTPGHKNTSSGDQHTTSSNLNTTVRDLQTTIGNHNTTPGDMKTTPREPLLTPGDKDTSGHLTTAARDLQTTIGDHNTTSGDMKTTPSGQTSDVEMTEELQTQEKEMLDKLKKYLVFTMSKGNPMTFKVKRFKPGAEEAFPAIFLPSPYHPKAKLLQEQFKQSAALYLNEKFLQHTREQLDGAGQ